MEQTAAGNQPSMQGSGRRNYRRFTTDDYLPQQNLENVPLSGITISAVAGTAFINADTAKINLSAYTGKEIVIADSSGFTSDDQIKGIIAAAGTAETLGSELHTTSNAVSDPNGNESGVTTEWVSTGFEGNETFEASQAQVAAGSWSFYLNTNATLEGGVYTFVSSGGTGKVYKATLSLYVVSGSVRVDLATAATLQTVFENRTGAWYTKTIVGTSDGEAPKLYIRSSGGAAEWYVDNVSVKQVTTPDSTGVWINSPSAADTWTIDGSAAGFNWNDTSYTIQVREPAFSITGAFTWAGWVKPDDGQPAAINAVGGKYDSTAGNLRAWAAQLQTNGKLRVFISSDGTLYDYSESANAIFSDGQQGWHFLAIVYDTNAPIIKGYLDGTELVLVDQAGLEDLGNTMYDSPSPFIIGARDPSSPTNFFNGGIGPWVLYNRALSGSEIVQLYNKDRFK